MDAADGSYLGNPRRGIMNMSSIVHSPAIAKEGQSSRFRRTGQIMQSMRLLDEAVAPGNTTIMSAIGNTSKHMSASTPMYPSNTGFASRLQSNMSMVSEFAVTQMEFDTINLLEPKTPARFNASNVDKFSYSIVENPGIAATASLFSDFKDCLLQHGSASEIYQLMESYEEVCADHEMLLAKLIPKISSELENDVTQDMKKILKHEKQTWRLVNALYRDRLAEDELDVEMNVDTAMEFVSERKAIEEYFKKNSDIRQAQIVIDWLEQNAADELTDVSDQLKHYTGQVSWENTLYQLKRNVEKGLQNDRNIVSEMDPDAPTRTRRHLHDLDREDETRLLNCMFSFIRGGRINEAEDLCIMHGQPWRAATLEGWRLHHDPNMVNASEDGGLVPVEGNSYRDMWKFAAWACSNDNAYDQKEKAIFGALCGNLKAMLDVSQSWEDSVWSYYKTMVDMATEQQIQRSHNIRKSWQRLQPMSLPEEYFKQKCDLDDLKSVFEKITSTSNPVIAKESNEPHHFIQRCIILNDIDALLDGILEWLHRDVMHHQLLRFIAHLLLLFQSIGTEMNVDKCAQILEAYVKQLIEDDRSGHLVAMYTASLPPPAQCSCYASFLEHVEDSKLRKEYVGLAEEAGLDVAAITKDVVERIRASGEPDTASLNAQNGADDPTIEPQLSSDDRRKIDAIDWLVFDQSQRSEALKQSNAVIRGFLASRKYSAARQVFHKIPGDSIDVINKEWHVTADKSVPLPAECDNAIREHLCMQAYLSAQIAFSDWFKRYHNKPEAYQPANQTTTFTSVSISDLVAEEHRQKTHDDEMRRWREMLEVLCDDARDKIYNVLLFPNGGWLVDSREDTPRNDDNDRRRHQMELLRRLYVPSLCDLLLNVIINTGGRNDQCANLADVVAAKDNNLYELFTKSEGRRLLNRIQDAMDDLMK